MPVMEINPVSAWISISYAFLSRYGPEDPYPERSQMMRRGYFLRSSGVAKPSRSVAPGARFCRKISAFSSKRSQDRLGFRPFQIQRQGFLGSVEPHKVAGLPSHDGIVAAREISDLGALDLDHARAQIRQLPRGERRGDGLLQGHDRDSRERQHQYDLGRPRTCSAR